MKRNEMIKNVIYRIIPSPLGKILLAGHEGGLAILSFQNWPSPVLPDPDWTESKKAFPEAVQQLSAYFAGRRKSFTLQLAPQGTTFQRRVWSVLERIPYGETRSYAEIARAIGNTKAVRAVGAANGANPLPLIVPCHRVIGANGRLVGYRGGTELKRRLLELESRRQPESGHSSSRRSSAHGALLSSGT